MTSWAWVADTDCLNQQLVAEPPCWTKKVASPASHHAYSHSLSQCPRCNNTVIVKPLNEGSNQWQLEDPGISIPQPLPLKPAHSPAHCLPHQHVQDRRSRWPYRGWFFFFLADGSRLIVSVLQPPKCFSDSNNLHVHCACWMLSPPLHLTFPSLSLMSLHPSSTSKRPSRLAATQWLHRLHPQATHVLTSQPPLWNYTAREAMSRDIFVKLFVKHYLLCCASSQYS